MALPSVTAAPATTRFNLAVFAAFVLAIFTGVVFAVKATTPVTDAIAVALKITCVPDPIKDKPTVVVPVVPVKALETSKKHHVNKRMIQ